MLQVTTKLADGDIAKEILFVNTFEGAQEIADIRPHTFNRVAVDLTKAIPIVVAGILFSTMTNGVSIPLYAVIALILIGIDQRIFAGESLNMLAEGNAFRIIDDPQRTSPVSRPTVPRIGGQSLAYVPRPRCLLARRRGRSCGSKCSSPFFSRILEHLIALRYLIGKWRVGLQMDSVGL